MNIIIIEDEPSTARELKRDLLSIDPSLKCMAILHSVKESVDWFTSHPLPDLIFSDIQLGDGTCFEIFQQINLQVPIIFCTAFDQYTIQAFEARGIHYLLKPIETSRLKESLQKYEELKSFYTQQLHKSEETGFIENLKNNLKQGYKTTLLVYKSDKIIPVKTDDILMIHLNESTTTLHTRQGQTYLSTQPLDEFESALSPFHFFRANRQYIIHRDAIVSIEHYFTRRLLVKTRSSAHEKIIISKLRSRDFLKWMEGDSFSL